MWFLRLDRHGIGRLRLVKEYPWLISIYKRSEYGSFPSDESSQVEGNTMIQTLSYLILSDAARFAHFD